MSKILHFLFSLHPKNHGKDYVQGWNCTGIRHGKKYHYRRKVLEFVCNIISGHEISETEWGYGGGDMVDCHCRWCDKVIKISTEEARFRYPTFQNWGRIQFTNEGKQ